MLPRNPPMEISPAPISFGLVDGRPVFMDIEKDCYFRLGPDEECDFLKSMKESGTVIGHGLAWCGAKEWKIDPGPIFSPATRTLPGKRTSATLSFADVFSVARLLQSVRKSLRTRSIASILKSLLFVRTDMSNAPADHLASAIRFQHARRFVPILGNCLADSLALMRWLGKLGTDATLVFGVKLDPFAAHCWVQSEGVLLNDRPERIQRFTPVRIIECVSATR